MTPKEAAEQTLNEYWEMLVNEYRANGNCPEEPRQEDICNAIKIIQQCVDAAYKEAWEGATWHIADWIERTSLHSLEGQPNDLAVKVFAMAGKGIAKILRGKMGFSQAAKESKDEHTDLD